MIVKSQRTRFLASALIGFRLDICSWRCVSGIFSASTDVSYRSDGGPSPTYGKGAAVGLASDTVTARTNAAPYVQRWCTALQEGPSLRRLILKACKFAVQPVCDRRATADGEGARHMYTRRRA